MCQHQQAKYLSIDLNTKQDNGGRNDQLKTGDLLRKMPCIYKSPAADRPYGCALLADSLSIIV